MWKHTHTCELTVYILNKLILWCLVCFDDKVIHKAVLSTGASYQDVCGSKFPCQMSAFVTEKASPCVAQSPEDMPVRLFGCRCRKKEDKEASIYRIKCIYVNIWTQLVV